MTEFYKQNRSIRSGLPFCLRAIGDTAWFQCASVRRVIYVCSYLLVTFFSVIPSYAYGNANKVDTADIQAQVSGEINCIASEVVISVSITTDNSSEGDIVVAWSGPSGFTSNLLQNTVSVPGIYYVEVMTGTDTLRDSVEVVRNMPPSPSVQIRKSGDFCTNEEVVLTCETDSDNSLIVWRAPGQVGYLDVETITATTPGAYIVTVIDQVTKCYTSDTITVYDIKPQSVSLPEDTQLTCGKPCVNLNLPNTEDISYSVEGPAGFYSQNATVSICESGSYTIKGISASSGCFISQSLTLTNLAMSAIARKTNDLSCKTTAVLVYGDSNDPDATFQWTGPNGFTSSVVANRVTAPGTYVLTVISQNNNACSVIDTVEVLRDISQPSLNVTKLNDLTCVTPSSVLTATTETAPVTFSWSGPNGFVAGNTNAVEVSDAGDYVVKVTKTSNGCSVTDTVSVSSTIVTLPSQMQYFLTCDHPCLKLNLPQVVGVEYAIRKISEFTPTTISTVTLCNPGFYELTATAPASGCVTSAWFEVIEDFGLKLAADKRNDIDCLKPSSVLTAFSPVSGVNYSWQGPGGFQAAGDSVTVTVAGVYTVSARDTVSNCYEEKSVEVLDNTYYPEVTVIKTKDLYCENDQALLVFSSSSDEVNVEWSGPLSFHSADARVNVNHAGVYTLQVTHLSSGCKVNSEIEVSFDSTAFTTTVFDPQPITCDRLSTQLNVISAITADYRWTGPEGFQSEEYRPLVSTPGTYSVTLTERFSKVCQLTDTLVVQAFNGPLQLSVYGGDIYCAPGTLSAVVENGDEYMLGYDDYTWTGPDGATFNGPYAVVSVPGIYSLEIKSWFTGCTASATTELFKFDCPESAEPASASARSAAALNVQPVVTAYPNPSKGAVVLSFVAAADTRYRLEVHSFDGVAYHLFDGDVKVGETNEVVFNAENNQHGLFVYRLITNDGVITGRFVITE